MDMKIESAHIQVPLHKAPGYVYRLWDAEGNCLYVGKTERSHPVMRVADHRKKPWWREVMRCDYIEVFHLDLLGEIEALQIRDCRPKYNIAGTSQRNDQTKRKHLEKVGYSGRNIYDTLGQHPCTINELIDLVYQRTGIQLKRSTVSQQLNILYRKNLVKCKSGHGRASTWYVSKEG